MSPLHGSLQLFLVLKNQLRVCGLKISLTILVQLNNWTEHIISPCPSPFGSILCLSMSSIRQCQYACFILGFLLLGMQAERPRRHCFVKMSSVFLKCSLNKLQYTFLSLHPKLRMQVVDLHQFRYCGQLKFVLERIVLILICDSSVV